MGEVDDSTPKDEKESWKMIEGQNLGYVDPPYVSPE
jgi:hypothetical protein